MSPSPNRISCPGCQSLMQVMDAGGVEVDWCPFCGGLWCDVGEANAATGTPHPPVLTGTSTARSCPRCATALGGGRLEPVDVDVCPSCSGVYFDAEELDRVAGKKVGLEPTGRARLLTFTCPGCASQFPYSDGHATPSGLSCILCLPRMSYGGGGGSGGAAYVGGLGEPASPTGDRAPRSPMSANVLDVIQLLFE